VPFTTLPQPSRSASAEISAMADAKAVIGLAVGSALGLWVGPVVGALLGAHVPQSAGQSSNSPFALQYAATLSSVRVSGAAVGDLVGKDDVGAAVGNDVVGTAVGDEVLGCSVKIWVGENVKSSDLLPHVKGQRATVSGSQGKNVQNCASGCPAHL